MRHEPSNTTIHLDTSGTQLDADVRQLRAIWVRLAQTNAVIEQATVAYKQSLELLNRNDIGTSVGGPTSRLVPPPAASSARKW
jgi:hypothetical protein